MRHGFHSRDTVLAFSGAVAVALFLTVSQLAAQQAPAPQQAPRTPREQASSDYTGYWVSVVTEDWRWRMVTPPKGDFTSIPLNAEGTMVGNSWDPATDGSCLAYG